MNKSLGISRALLQHYSNFDSKIIRILVAIFSVALSCLPSVEATAATQMAKYDVYEVTLTTTNNYANPYTNVTLSGTFQGPNKSITISGFWNGGNTWKIRMAPIEAGEWTYTTSSNDTQLNNKSGSFTVSDSIGGLNGHGHIELDTTHSHKFQYSDGTPFFFLGHSIEWHRQGARKTFTKYPEEYEKVAVQRGKDGFTVMNSYGGPGLEKPIFASNEGGPNFHNQDLDQINPTYFREVDERLQLTVDNGLGVTIALSFADQGIWSLNRTKLERAWKYVVARYAAYPVIWQPVGEYNEGSVTRARELGQLTRVIDPYNHPQSMHATGTSVEFAGEKWFDFIVHQTSGKCSGASICPSIAEQTLQDDIDRSRIELNHALPIVQEEFRTTDVTLTRKAAWRYFASNVYYTLTMANHTIWDDRIEHLKHLKKFVDGTTFQKLEPHQELVSRGDCLANPGDEYVVYLSDGGSVTVNLSDSSGSLQAKWYNTRTGEYQGLITTTGGGNRSFNAPDSQDWALHISAIGDDSSAPQSPRGLKVG